MKQRPPVGMRVRLNHSAGLPRESCGKCGTVVAHHVDLIAVVVRLDPLKPLRPYFKAARSFDVRMGLKGFRRREGDWIVDYHSVREIAGSEPRRRRVSR